MAKLKLIDIQREVQDNGWKLISKEYINLDSSLNFQCPEGHSVQLSMKKWRRSHECPICKNNPLKNTTQTVTPKGKNIFRVLGLDQATNISGWSIFDNQELMAHGIYTTNGSDEEARIEDFRAWLINMIANWNPDYIAFEDIQLQQHGDISGDNIVGVTTYKVLAHLQGVISNTLYNLKIPHSIIPPATWRNYCHVLGKYKADKKKSAQLIVKSKYDISVSNDEADAICIGEYGSHTFSKNMEMMEWE